MNNKNTKSKKSKALMVQGTSSHCGKSLFVATFCKIFKDAGYRVAPFKAQNMSLNSFVTENGEEIARAQALQAFACGIEPTADMNPILLKPKGDMISQIVLHGKPYKDISARDYYSEFALKEGIKSVEESLARLMADYDIIFIEGAGSPAEINLYESDIANMRIAELTNAPVLLVVDIDRGGAFASLVGTLELLKPEHKEIVKGFIINKFRGQSILLEPGLRRLEQITGKPVLGIVPYIQDLTLPDEDSMSLERDFHWDEGKATIAIIRLPRISNFTDFDPLEAEASVNIRYVRSVKELGMPDTVIIPGTKNTIQDLLWLKEKGLAREIIRLAKLGIPIFGICGGYQIIGKRIIDRKGIEGSSPGEFDGLGLLDVTTEFSEYDKVTKRVTAQIVANGPMLNSGMRKTIIGYEIHMGKTSLGKNARPAFKVTKRGDKRVDDFDGAIDNNGLVLGTYIHGIFDRLPVRRCLIDFLMKSKGIKSRNRAIRDIRKEWEKSLRKISDVVKTSLDMNRICEIIGIPPIKG
ncbi:MAG: cobyric acid synthase [archaeon]|nr:cobyric acid synthase [archaeon]MCP8319319.1 cobyric acid synthase [archaeon]